jgi:Tol biopolymer transport system component
MTNDSNAAGDAAVLWVDRRGQAAQAARFTQSWGGVALSGDGRYVAAAGWSLWIHDISRGVATRAKAESAPGLREPIQMPAWSPTGEYVAYRSMVNDAKQRTDAGRRLRVLKLASGTSEDLFGLEGKQPGYPSWFPDGRSLVFVVEGEPGPSRSEVLSIALADRKTQSLFSSAQAITGLRLSPDGQWLAYASAASENFRKRWLSGGGRPTFFSGRSPDKRHRFRYRWPEASNRSGAAMGERCSLSRPMGQ